MKSKAIILSLVFVVIIAGLASSFFKSQGGGSLPELAGGPGDGDMEEDRSFTSPLQITETRKREFPGSEVAIERELGRGINYSRYIASYSSDGLKIFGLLTIPDGKVPEGGYPAIVFNHGWVRPDEYRTTEKYVAYQDAIARSGYVVFKPDYRGHGDSEGFPEGAYFSDAYTIDVLNALGSLKKMPEVNPEKIGMWGHSMGGFLTLKSMVVTEDVKVGVVWGGVVAGYEDLLFNWRRGSRSEETDPEISESRMRRKEEFLNILPSEEESRAFWASISPIEFVADISGPVQIHHGLADETVPFEFSKSLENKLTREDKVHEAYYYEEGNHNLSGTSFGPAMSRTIEYFDRFLKD